MRHGLVRQADGEAGGVGGEARSAAPKAKPICCIVGTDDAATASSPFRAPLMIRCATNAQQMPMPTPIPKIARYRGTAACGEQARRNERHGHREGADQDEPRGPARPRAPATSNAAAVQPSEAHATP